ncbi:MAG: acyltransferase [Pirellulales bacterium]|nr:acyltransferase [Pirellulales bacterium]
MLDLLRFAAAIAIVWLHAASMTPALAHAGNLGRFGVPFFVLATVFLVIEGIRHDPERRFVRYSQSRFVKIMIPFAAWTAIGLAGRAVKWAMGQPVQEVGVEVLWAGSLCSLWFLPFILVINLLVFGLARATMGRPATRTFLVFATALIGAALAFIPRDAVFTIPSTYWRHVYSALPAVFWGVTLGFLWDWPVSRVLQRWSASACGVAIWIATTVMFWDWAGDQPIECLAGLGAMIVALHPAPRCPEVWTKPLNGLAFGVYLSHMLFINGFTALARQGGMDAITATSSILIFAAALPSSILTTWLLRRWSRTRWLAP